MFVLQAQDTNTGVVTNVITGSRVEILTRYLKFHIQVHEKITLNAESLHEQMMETGTFQCGNVVYFISARK